MPKGLATMIYQGFFKGAKNCSKTYVRILRLKRGFITSTWPLGHKDEILYRGLHSSAHDVHFKFEYGHGLVIMFIVQWVRQVKLLNQKRCVLF